MSESAWLNPSRWAAALLVFGACAQASLAQADQVVLASGAVLEGKAKREGGKVIVTTDSGEIALPEDMVKRIEPGNSGVQEFETRLARIAPGDVRGLLALANYCRDHEMPAHEKQALQKIIELDPDHAEARARLGYEKTPTGWMTQDEQMEARGYVQYQGRWITRDAMLEIERGLLDSMAARIEDERDRARSLQAEFDEQQAQDASWSSWQAQPAYSPSYWYQPYYSRTNYGYRPAGYFHERGYTAPAPYHPAPTPAPARTASAPPAMRMGDVHTTHVPRPRH